MFYFLNDNIKHLRKKNGLSQPELAKLLSVSKSTVANIESDFQNTSLEILDKLHNIFNISLDDLVYKDLSKDNN